MMTLSGKSIWLYYKTNGQAEKISKVAKKYKLKCEGSGINVCSGETDVSYSCGKHDSKILEKLFKRIKGVSVEVFDHEVEEWSKPKTKTAQCEYCGKKGRTTLAFYVCNKCNKKKEV